MASEKVLSPMFLTHVECTGCHIETSSTGSGALNSFGKVAKAVPGACDRCHEEGTGLKYIPFWQGKTKKLYEKINSSLEQLQVRAKDETDKISASKLTDKCNRAKKLLEAVVDDGSWGVHNLKYTEAILLEAKAMLTGKDYIL